MSSKWGFGFGLGLYKSVLGSSINNYWLILDICVGGPNGSQSWPQKDQDSHGQISLRFDYVQTYDDTIWPKRAYFAIFVIVFQLCFGLVRKIYVLTD